MNGLAVPLGSRYPLLVVVGCVAILAAGVTLSTVSWPDLAHHALASTARLLVGLLGAALSSLLLVIVFHRRIQDSSALLSALTFLDAIPTLAWIPLLQLTAFSDAATVVSVTTIGGTLPLTISAVRGISQADRYLVLSAQLLGASGARLWLVMIQSARPAIVAGTRNCVYQAARTVIGAEILTTVTFGLGQLAVRARHSSSVEGVMAAAVVIGSLVALLDTLVLRRLQQKTEERWQTGGQRR